MLVTEDALYPQHHRVENKLNPWLKLTSGTRTDQSSEFVGESDEAPLYVGPLTLVGDDTVIMVFVLFDDRYLFVHNDVGDCESGMPI